MAEELTRAQAFILRFPRYTLAADIVAQAKAEGLKLSVPYVYGVRADRRFKDLAPASGTPIPAAPAAQAPSRHGRKAPPPQLSGGPSPTLADVVGAFRILVSAKMLTPDEAQERFAARMRL